MQGERYVVGEEQVKEFREKGFVKLKGIIKGEEL